MHAKILCSSLTFEMSGETITFCYYSLSDWFQGILFCTSECLKTSQDLLKIYLHESNRVYRDKMVEDKDFDIFDKLQSEMVKKFYEVRVLWLERVIKGQC